MADMDRGGVFASVYGTIALLDREEAALVRAFAVNRFRGDPALFADAVDILETKTGDSLYRRLSTHSRLAAVMKKTASLSSTGRLQPINIRRLPSFNFLMFPITRTASV